jgi:hypothetical protein
MTRFASEARCARVAAVTLISTLLGPAANARPPRPVEPSTRSIVVERVEVAVPVDDTSTEIEQMLVVAALAATIAAAVTKKRVQRRYSRRPAANTIIDITDPCASIRMADDIAGDKELVPLP